MVSSSLRQGSECRQCGAAASSGGSAKGQTVRGRLGGWLGYYVGEDGETWRNVSLISDQGDMFLCFTWIVVN